MYYTLFTGVITLALIASLYLLLRRRNAIMPDNIPPLRVRRWTAALFATIAVGHLWWMLIYYTANSIDIFNRVLICTILDTVITLPMFVCTMLVMLQDRRRPLWPVAIIVAIGLADLLMVTITGNRMSAVVLLMFFVLVLFISIYMVRAVREYHRWLRNNYADLEHKEVGRTFLVMSAILPSIIAYGFANDSFACEVLLEVFDVIVILVLLWRVETLHDLEVPAVKPIVAKPVAENSEESVIKNSEKPEAANSEKPEAANSEKSVAENNEKPAQAKAGDDQLLEIGHLLVEYCEQDQFYLNRDLSVYQLAEHLGTDRERLSLYFLQHGITYNTYINGLRILHFIRLCEKTTTNKQNATASQLASACGFSSYSTFCSAFKQTMGQTITSWLQSPENTTNIKTE